MDTESVLRIFADLRNKNDDVRQRAGEELRNLLALGQRELSAEAFSRFSGDVNKRIFELIHGNDTNDRIGGIIALDKLIDFDGDDNAQKTTRYAHYLRSVIRGNDTAAMALAAKALGRLATPGGPLTAELVESETRQALEWLQTDRQENRRFAAVLLLRELARNSPTLFYVYVPQVLELIWVALRDPKVLIRDGAAEALSACLEIVYQRDSQLRLQWYNKILEEAQHGLKIGTTDSIHGSLLTYRELLLRAGMFMHERYRDVCEVVLRFKDHRDSLIRRSVITLIPILAAYSPEDFVNLYLHKCIVHLQAQLRKDRDRNVSFLAIGQVAIAVGSSMNPYLDAILQSIKEGLTTKGRNRNVQNDSSHFQCISMLATAVGLALTKHMHDLLDLMFACPLSEPLTQALVDLAHYIPPLLHTIQEKLLNMLSMVLSGRPFKPLGSPSEVHPMLPPVGKDHKDAITAESRDAEIVLALHTLGSFDFTGHVLNEFVRDCAIKYVEDENAEVRKAAALTCCQLFVRDPICYQTSNHAIQVVGEVMEKLLTVGIADPDPEIRRTVLQSLDARFDRHLARAENVRSLFLALNDESFPIREAAMTIIGRLTMHNPAYVMPSLRKTLIQLLTDLEYSNVSRNKEESAKLLSHLVCSSQKLIKPYVEPIVTVLLPKARDPSAGVASSILTALGELATVGGEDMRPYIPELMPLIIDTLQDQSSSTKRDAALRTLGQLASNSGYVIEPYIQYPQLLNILVNIVKTEQTGYLRKETIKLMGILGALDPYKHQIVESGIDNQMADQGHSATDVSLMMTGLTPSSEDYYPTVVINSLMNMLKDQSLGNHHSAVIDAIMSIFKTLGLKCVPFLGQIIPGFVAVIRSSPPSKLESYFNQLSILVSIVKQHIRNFLPDILQLIRDHWHPTSNIQGTILQLIEAIARSLEGEFKVYLAQLLPLMLQVLEMDNSTRRIPTERVLHAFLVFGSSSEEYMHLILPVIVRMFEKQSQPPQARKLAIETIAKLSRKVNISDHASRIIHPLSRVLLTGSHELRMAALDTLCALVLQLGHDYAHYIPMINKCLIVSKIQHTNYELLVLKLLRGEPLPQDLNSDKMFGDKNDETILPDTHSKKQTVNQQHLKNAWEASQRSTREDWQEWIRRFSVELLKESPSHALRACAGLAGVYYPLAKDLFNAAFVSCWTELYDQYQEELVRSIETALTSPNIPPEILQILLNLAEFMEHDDKALPIDIRTLGIFAAKCHAFAKALHYKETEFLQEPQTSTIEALISINNQLQQSDAAIGILRRAQQYNDVPLKETWFEKLQRWEEALKAYQLRELDEPNSFEVTMGKMRCLHALGEWEQLSQLAQEKWSMAGHEMQRTIAPLAAAAAWGLGQWDLMDDYINVMKAMSPDRSFFGAILALHRNHFEEAAAHIEKAREALDTELSALVSESYNRAYSVIVRVQMLAELEEIITYKQNRDQPEKQETMRRTWMKRLKGCQRNVEVWQRMLKVRALVISPKENMEMWIKFANLCRKSGRIGLAEKSLNSLLDVDESVDSVFSSTRAPPQVVYAHLKYMYATGNQDEALHHLSDFTERMSQDLGVSPTADPNQRIAKAAGANPPQNMVGGNTEEYTQLLARCYLKQGDWQVALQKNWFHDNISEVLRSYWLATHYNRDWYKAWHAWALANFEVVTNRDMSEMAAPVDLINNHVIPAVRGFFRSISLSAGSSLQDTLRLLTLWFAYGGHQQVNAAVVEGFSVVTIDTWLEVVPQLIARINQPDAVVRRAIHQLLGDVGRAHPQALVYPLTVAAKSHLSRRQKSAVQLMESMKGHSSKLVEQAEVVSQELIRVAVLWHEQWHEGLEEASRLYFGDHNIEAMFATLEPLHEMLERGPETLREISFHQAFGRDLHEARDWCNTYKRTQEVGDLNQAWDLYYQVFRKITKQLPQLNSLDLQYVSPRLLNARDLDLAAPGTYQSGRPVVRIINFDPTFTVISSKQRPRKASLRGSDGTTYQYVLKGHEDIRQDERVMQLFGLVNTLLSVDSECFKRHLNIQRYPAIPLSQNSGLLGWVPNSDTLHVLIREYRESRKILLNIEHRIMLQMAPDYDNLTLMQKVEVFGYALDNTTGQDLYRVLWLKSKSSEAWLDRRTNYTRSLGVMSMAGYILGLGDRHPSNLMLDRVTGKIVHIDFGDCFEVAMHREKYPEKVPFRLTRMLTYAMEVSNIEGSFRTTCEAVMRVLRDNKESLMAVLEAFMHDPLMHWRLGNKESPAEPLSTMDKNKVPGEPDNQLGFRPNRPPRPDETDDQTRLPETQNARAMIVLDRVKDKLTGRDFKTSEDLPVPDQVDKLLQQATSLENLCQLYVGWCAFW